MYVRNYMNIKSILTRGGVNLLFDDWKKKKVKFNIKCKFDI